jgi:hypothetical protein
MTHADSVKRLKELDKYEKSKAKKAGKSSGAANNIRKSPRNLTKQEKIAADVMGNKKLRSDKARKAEMIKRGISPDADFVDLVGRARDKQRSKKK